MFSHIFNFTFTDNVISVINQTYDMLYERFLIRGLPVIIEKSHPNWEFDNFTEYLFKHDELIESNPCELQSNLIFGKYSSLEDILDLAFRSHENDSWFLHFQNCDFEAVKKSRLIMEKPRYLSFHLEPFQTSWVLMSQFYESKWKKLKVLGLILVMQLQGDGEFLLESKEPCDEYCGDHYVVIHESEAILFVTDLWELFYRPSEGEKSISFITETDWNP